MVSRSLKPCLVFSVFYTVLVPLSSFSQVAPGGINGASLWHAESNLQATIGNHHTFNLLELDNQSELINPEGASTLFFVLQPKSLSPSGEEFMRLGDIQIYDDHFQFGRTSTPIEFTDDSPTIVTIETVNSQRYARRSSADLLVGDTSLYEIAELVVYPKSLTRGERRKVNSYLALKYSITVTTNKEEIWQDYLRADNFTYWNRQIDGSHEVRVLGIGRLDNQQFLQTQTVTTKGAHVLVALDEVKPIGEQPDIELDDDAFIILSESSHNRPSNLTCSNEGQHPLSHWKLQLQNWTSEAQELIIHTPLLEKANETDSLFLTDGGTYIPLQRVTLHSEEEYRVSLALLSNYRHYFFITKSTRDCELLTTETQNGELTVSLSSEEDQELFVDILNLTNGSSIQEPYEGQPITQFIDDGQFLVQILDADGNRITSKVIRNNTNTSATYLQITHTIRLFPDPVSRGQLTTLSVQDLSGEGPLKLTLSNMQGHVLETEDTPFASSFDWEFNAPEVPGVYTVSLYSGKTTYSVKLIVAQ